jgi:hypothetical protein
MLNYGYMYTSTSTSMSTSTSISIYVKHEKHYRLCSFLPKSQSWNMTCNLRVTNLPGFVCMRLKTPESHFSLGQHACTMMLTCHYSVTQWVLNMSGYELRCFRWRTRIKWDMAFHEAFSTMVWPAFSLWWHIHIHKHQWGKLQSLVSYFLLTITGTYNVNALILIEILKQ